MSNAEPTEARQIWLYAQQYELEYRLELSAAYHGKRERFLLTCERTAQGLAAVSATAAFSQALQAWPVAELAFGVLTALAAVTPLVFGWAGRANHHAVLAGDHRRLLGRMRRAGFELTEAQLLQLRGDMAEIEATEGASLGALVVQCQNELAATAKNPAPLVPLRWYHRATMHLFDWHVSASALRG
jgi:hypothetical protein